MGWASFHEDVLKRLDADFSNLFSDNAIATESHDKEKLLAIKKVCEEALQSLRNLLQLARDPKVSVGESLIFLKRENKNLVQENQILRAESSSFKSELAELRDELVSAQDQISNHKKDLGFTKNKNLILSEKVLTARAAPDKELKASQLQVKSTEDENRNLRAQIARLTRDNQRLSQLPTSIERRKKELRDYKTDPAKFYDQYPPESQK